MAGLRRGALTRWSAWYLAARRRRQGEQETRQLTEAPRDTGWAISAPCPRPTAHTSRFIRERTFSRSAVFVVPLTAGGVPAGSAAQLTPETWNVNGSRVDRRRPRFIVLVGRPLRPVAAESNPGDRYARWLCPSDALPFGDQATALAISKSGRVVYSAQFRDTALYEAPLSGSSHQPLAGSGFSSTFDEATPHYSPDGARIAFSSTRSGVEEILDRQPRRVETSAGDVVRGTAVLESPMVARWPDDPLQLASGRLVRPVYPRPRNRRGPSADDRAIGRKRSALVARRTMDLFRVEPDGPGRGLANPGRWK